MRSNVPDDRSVECVAAVAIGGRGFVFLRVMDATRMLCRRQQTEQALHETFRGGVARYSWSATECRQIYQLMKI